MDEATRDFVRRRAGDRCEYCLLPQRASILTFQIEHIIAKQHLDDDMDDPDSLAEACNRCNAYKGPNLSSIAPLTKQQTPLFNPRQDAWSEHFRLEDGEIIGLTPIGRATVRLLNMNAPQRVELRNDWVENADSLP